MIFLLLLLQRTLAGLDLKHNELRGPIIGRISKSSSILEKLTKKEKKTKNLIQQSTSFSILVLYTEGGAGQKYKLYQLLYPAWPHPTSQPVRHLPYRRGAHRVQVRGAPGRRA